MGKMERAVLLNVVRKLQGEDAAPEVRAVLTGPARIYLETWVIPALKILASDGDRDLRLALNLASVPAPKKEG